MIPPAFGETSPVIVGPLFREIIFRPLGVLLPEIFKHVRHWPSYLLIPPGRLSNYVTDFVYTDFVYCKLQSTMLFGNIIHISNLFTDENH